MKASWQLCQYGGKGCLQEVEKTAEALNQFWRDTLAHTTLQNLLRPEKFEQIRDPALRKHLQIMAKNLTPNEPEPLDEAELKLYKEGLRLRDYYNRCPDYARYRMGLWKPKGEDQTYGALLAQLIRDRNAFARQKGFDNYYAYQLSEQGFNPERFDQMLDTLLDTVNKTHHRLHQRIKSSRLREAHKKWRCILRGDLKRQEPEALLRRTAALMDLPIEQLLKDSDLYADPERPGKEKGGLAFYFDLPHHIHTLANMPRDSSERDVYDYVTILHEVIGHGLDHQFIDPKLPPFLRQLDGFSSEAQAVLFEALIHDDTWLEQVAEIPQEILEVFRPYRNLTCLDDHLSDIRWQLFRVHLEQALYQNGAAHCDELYLKAGKKVDGYDADPDATRGKWANFGHFAGLPVRVHQYLLGDLWRAQVTAHLNEQFGGVLTPEAAQHLKQVRSKGQLHEWPEQIEQLTGKPLGTEAWVQELAALEAAVMEDATPKTDGLWQRGKAKFRAFLDRL